MINKEKLKKSWRSKTIWFNAILIPILAESKNLVSDLQPYMPEHWYGYIILLGVIGNVILRFKTQEALEDK